MYTPRTFTSNSRNKSLIILIPNARYIWPSQRRSLDRNAYGPRNVTTLDDNSNTWSRQVILLGIHAGQTGRNLKDATNIKVIQHLSVHLLTLCRFDGEIEYS